MRPLLATLTDGVEHRFSELVPRLADHFSLTPEEGYAAHRSLLVSEVLARLRSASPGFFEQVVVDLLVAMGYGGSRHDAGRAVGRTGDGGIDGIIKEDRLGLDAVYVQAKRWEGTVGRPSSASGDMLETAGTDSGKASR
jgi:restriction endonuclease Mrr